MPYDQREDDYNAKMGATPAPQMAGCDQEQAPSTRRPSPFQEMEKQLRHHDESAKRIARGVAFLRQHPEFEEFIQLIRTGSIDI
jgi:hypothetical protein